jgi:argininosuccinate lyase
MVWPALAEAERALALARIAAATARPNEELLLARARANFSTATDLADALVRGAAMDFRTAHHVAGAVVRRLMDAGLGAHQADAALVDEAAMEVAGRKAGLPDDVVARALDPVRGVAARDIVGGPAPVEVRRMAAAMEVARLADAARLEGFRARLAGAAGEREAGLRGLAA